MTQENTSSPSGEPVCPCCGAGEERHEVAAQRESVPYGSEGKAVDAIVPVHTCTACQFRWTDESGSVIQEFVVKEALEHDRVLACALARS